MKKYIKKDLIIWLIMILSIIVIGLHLKFEFENNFLIALLNLSYSYLAATFFYIGQVCIPTIKNEKKALIVLQPYLHNISDKMSFFSEFTNIILKTNNGELNIIGDDNGIIYYHLNNNMNGFKNYREYFRNFEESIKCEIELLKKNYLYSSLPDDLLDILSSIEMQKYSNIKSISDLYPMCKSYDSLENELNEIKDNLAKIREYDNKINNNTIVLLNDVEKEEYKKRLLEYQPITQMINQEIYKNRKQ